MSIDGVMVDTWRREEQHHGDYSRRLTVDITLSPL